MTLDRLLSLVIAAAYLTAAALTRDARAVLGVLMLIILALGLIWFGEEFGEYAGPMGHSLMPDSASPGCLVKLFGWAFLLAPAAFMLYDFLNRPPE